MRTIPTVGSAVAATAALLLLTAPAAQAHVTVSADTATAGSYAVLTFSVPHGCEGSATTAVAIEIPEEIASVTPTINPSWTVQTTQETLDQPTTDSHGNEVTERDATVTYTAIDPLPADLRDTFELSVLLPQDAAGTTLYFPAVQTCEQGETAWVQLPAEGQDADQLDHPAPSLTVTAPGEPGQASGEEADTGSAAAGTDAAATSPAGDDAGGDPLALVALVVGSLGLVLGVVALLRRRPSA